MLYLASTSPRRKKLLRENGFLFKTLKPVYEEKDKPGLSPATLVKLHALAKADSVAGHVRQGAILVADTIVYFKKKIIGKPKNGKDALRMLGALQGRRHTVYTAVALLWIAGGIIQKKKVFVEKTDVYLKPLTHAEIQVYFRKINPLDKAGAYAIQSRNSIVQKVRGSFSNAVGLPMEALEKYL